jgi:hypothetical protein
MTQNIYDRPDFSPPTAFPSCLPRLIAADRLSRLPGDAYIRKIVEATRCRRAWTSWRTRSF